MLSWWWNGGDAPAVHLTKVSGAGMSDSNGPILPGQEQAPVSLGLQREDGSFVGTALIGDKWATLDALTPYMVAFDATGNVLWSVANEQPQIATADNGVIGKSGITYDQSGRATGQLENSNASVSWSAGWYLGSGNLSAFALPLIDIPTTDDLGLASVWAFAGGNPSQNGTAFLECCSPSLAWVLGPTDHSSDPPDVVKSYTLNGISCSKSPSQIISDMEGNFGSFANYSGTYNFIGIPWLVSGTATFSGSVAQGATISIHNVNVDTVTGGRLRTVTFDVAVQVTQINSTSFTFTTLPGHVLYPATISFTASSPGLGLLSFVINVNGSFANKEAEIGYMAAGKYFEDKIWNHVLVGVQSDCRH